MSMNWSMLSPSSWPHMTAHTKQHKHHCQSGSCADDPDPGCEHASTELIKRKGSNSTVCVHVCVLVFVVLYTYLAATQPNQATCRML